MYHYFQGMLSISHQEQKIFLSDLILIAILVNNAFKTVQQRVKDKEDICKRADAGFHPLMDWIKMRYFRGSL